MELWTLKNENSDTYVPLFNLNLDTDNWTTLYTGETLQKQVDQRILLLFGSRTFPVVVGSPIGLWDNIWKAYQVLNDDNIQRAYEALQAHYNPVENYDRHATISTTKKGREVVQDSYGGTSVTTTAGMDTSTTSVSPENNSTFYGTEKTEVNQGLRTTSAMPVFNTHTTSYEGATPSTNREDTVTEEIHGNIGTTKNQEMVSLETSLRLGSDLLVTVFTRFILENCY